jgi:hypothetical protein
MDYQSMISERPPRPMTRCLISFATCLYVAVCAGSIPQAHAQGGQNAPRPKTATPARAGADRPAAKPSAKPATAQESSANDASSEAYRDFVEQALSEFKLENWPEARLLFRRAHELNPSARTFRGIGMVSYEMRDYVPAVLALTAALADTRQPLTPAQRKECEALLVRARTFVGSYALSLEPPRLALTVDGSAAEFDTDGHLLVGFGEHTLQASAPGYDTTTKPLSVQGGEAASMEIVLQLSEAQTMAGSPSTQEHTAPRGAPLVPRTSPAPAASLHTGGLKYTWVALGAGAVFGGAAVGSWIVGENKFQDLKDQCEQSATQGSQCVRGETDVSSAKRFERLTNAMLGMSAVSLVTAAVLLPIEWPRERRLALDVGPTNIAIRGKF